MGRVEDKVALITGAESAAGEVIGLARASALIRVRSADRYDYLRLDTGT